MAAVRCDRNTPKSASIPAATLTVLVPGDDVRVIWVVPEAAIWVFYSSTLRDGDTTPALGVNGIPVAAGEKYPIRIPAGKRALVASQSGTIAVVLDGAYE
jgi:hypothetical protein